MRGAFARITSDAYFALMLHIADRYLGDEGTLSGRARPRQSSGEGLKLIFTAQIFV